MDSVKSLLQQTPEIALFLCLAAGYAVGKIRLWKLSLGGVAGTLIVAIFVGMAGHITIDDQVKNIAFALFIFTLGYISGPTFFASLNRKSLKYGAFTLVEVASVLAITALATVVMHLDVGTAAGLLAGGATESAAVGTATDAIARLDLPAEQIKTLQANVGTAYSISYICGLIVVVILTSQIFPLVMRVNLRTEADKLWKQLGGGTDEDDTHRRAAPELVGRAFRVTHVAGQQVSRVRTALGGHTTIERLRRRGVTVAVDADTVLENGDEILVVGTRQDIVPAETTIGPEIVPSTDLNMELDIAQVVLDHRHTRPDTLGELSAELGKGSYITGLVRDGRELPLRPNIPIQREDTLTLTGAKSDLARTVPGLGYRLDPSVKADIIYIALGVALGFLLGKIVLQVGDIPLTLGTGGGCLLTGLLFGWFRSRNPVIGQYAPAAADVIKTLGLSIFIAVVGLTSGPQAVHLVQEFGIGLPIAGVLMTAVPACLSLILAWKVMKLPAPLALGAITGQQCSTPGITAVQQVAGNATPLIAYTIVYALSNVVLPLLGPIVVAMATALT
ncbi:putative transporter, aspartate/alanine exchanger family [Nocardia nova SH22a]|uniref:Putative transporter, aspartate/alanine exchanger family n=1 Tax=Nocardia nova SH22a TaxID=1415166 RepID=W5TNZ0_9NOCA|nr:aspartate-alanine antiporter [Nocardia nova]AHH20967.1 putative transporter, aspartate/alanine exchanger family [Nocardia nova SH22a]